MGKFLKGVRESEGGASTGSLYPVALSFAPRRKKALRGKRRKNGGHGADPGSVVVRRSALPVLSLYFCSRLLCGLNFPFEQ